VTLLAPGDGPALLCAPVFPPSALTRARSGFSAQFCGVFLTEGDTQTVMADPALLQPALLDACQRAASEGAQSVVIGGGPLAVAARALASSCPVPLIEPIPAAVRLAQQRACTNENGVLWHQQALSSL